MKTLIDVLAPYDSIAIAGMAKNAGKTTTLNYMIHGFAGLGETLGLTSIGLDGEETDQVTVTPKPRIHVPAGTIIATAEHLLMRRERGLNDIGREILAVTDISTPLGRIVVARALSAGNVMLAGPSMVSQIAPLMKIFQDFSVSKIIIDGAVGRKSLAAPEIVQAVVLATGASLSKDIKAVIAETRHIAEIFNLPTVSDCPPNAGHIHIPGAITDSKLDGLYDKHIIAENPTKILISPKALAKLHLGGGTLSIKTPINLAAITINPISPYGTNFDAAHFLDKMQQAINIPIFNIAGESCARPHIEEELC